MLFSCIGYYNGYGNSIPVMLQGITSAFCVRIPVSILMSKLPNTSLMLVGLATPITTIYGILFFTICFLWIGRKTKQQKISKVKFLHNLQFPTNYDIFFMLYMFVIGQTFLQTTVIVNYNAYE